MNQIMTETTFAASVLLLSVVFVDGTRPLKIDDRTPPPQQQRNFVVDGDVALFVVADEETSYKSLVDEIVVVAYLLLLLRLWKIKDPSVVAPPKTFASRH